MKYLSQLFDRWHKREPGTRRILIVLIHGLEPTVVDHYLDGGLLHNLALLCDLGTRCRTSIAGRLWCDSIAAAARERGLRVDELVPPSPSLPSSLKAICHDDQLQQERLIERLNRRSSGVVVSTFDMPARLQQLFGRQLDERRRCVIRDAYARMDEIVGKVYSFMDERTTLLVLISPFQGCQRPDDGMAQSYIFSNRRNISADNMSVDLVKSLFS